MRVPAERILEHDPWKGEPIAQAFELLRRARVTWPRRDAYDEELDVLVAAIQASIKRDAALARAYLEAEKALRTMLNLAVDWVAYGTAGNIAELIEVGEAFLAEHEPVAGE